MRNQLKRDKSKEQKVGMSTTERDVSFLTRSNYSGSKVRQVSVNKNKQRSQNKNMHGLRDSVGGSHKKHNMRLSRQASDTLTKQSKSGSVDLIPGDDVKKFGHLELQK